MKKENPNIKTQNNKRKQNNGTNKQPLSHQVVTRDIREIPYHTIP